MPDGVFQGGDEVAVDDDLFLLGEGTGRREAGEVLVVEEAQLCQVDNDVTFAELEVELTRGLAIELDWFRRGY